MKDSELEKMWKDLSNADYDEDEVMEQILVNDCHIWKAGTTRSEIWEWFNENYSRGLYYLLYKIGKEDENAEANHRRSCNIVQIVGRTVRRNGCRAARGVR